MKDKPAGFIHQTDVLGQEVPDIPIEVPKESEKKRNPKNYSSDYRFPSLSLRYFSMILDVGVILLLSLGFAELFEIMGEVNDYIRLLVFIIVVFLYEPILISTACTFGQLISNIRVRKISDPMKRLGFPHAVLRILFKTVLGIVSFLTVTFNPNRRAIHDFVSGSMVIIYKEENDKMV